MLKIRWTNSAVQDLDHIEAFIRAEGTPNAVEFILFIIERIETTIAQYPGSGREGRLLGTREFVVHENYVVPYRVKDGYLEILRVLHVGRQWPDLDKKPD